MANTYTQIYLQVVFAVQGRKNLIQRNHKEELYKYITGIIRNKDQKVITINGMPDHVHIFIGMKPTMALSDLVRDIKNNSSSFINEKRWMCTKFRWQEGFGAFSYSHSQIGTVVKYIQNQEKHHAKRSFKDEYLETLRRFNVEFDERYVFNWVEDDED